MASMPLDVSVLKMRTFFRIEDLFRIYVVQ